MAATRRFCCFLVAVGIVLSTALVHAQSPANVIVILADDQGWGDLSLHGNPNLSTPNLDAMARDGAELEHFYVCAVCSPTRAEFLTGRYHTRMGVHSTSTGGERFDAGEQTIAEVFRDAGYATAAYGKWHSGMQYPYHPNARGFDDYYGFCSGHWGDYYSPLLEHNGRLVQGDGFLVDDLTNHAMDFITDHREEPFFVYLPLNTPHSPMQVPDPFWDKFADKPITADPAPANAGKTEIDHTRAALAMCENIDWNVGRLLQHLDTSGLSQQTIVVYFSDNGPNGARFNGGMRGRKGSTFEGGLRSPCLIRYPQQVPAGTQVQQIAAAIDLLPTLADLAGIAVTSPRPLDGVSLAPLLRGQANGPWPDRTLMSAWNGKATARKERYRMQADGTLYDLQNDPGEQHDIAKQQPEVASALGQQLSAWIAETNPAPRNKRETRPITVGHPDAEFTQLPARDAEPSGGVVRSNKFPNCTYMTQWTDTADAITWDAEVLAAGDFEVQMLYACQQGSEGATIELAMGDQKIRTRIDHAHDVPLRGMEHDRVERAEGYVKDWGTITLGTLHLEPGRGPLTLRAIDVPGKEVAEMRLLMLRRVRG